MFRLRMNRRGHIPTILLFVLALALVLTAWWTFLSYGKNLEVAGNSINEAIINLNFKQDYVESSLRKMIEDSIALSDKNDFLDSFNRVLKEQVTEEKRTGDFGNLFGRIKNGDYDLVLQEGRYNLSVGEVFVSSKVGKNELRRKFDLNILFDENGLLSD